MLKQSLAVTDQVPPLIESIATGSREFSPSTEDTREVCRRMYRARRTLIIKFDEDTIDESQGIYQVLQESQNIMRMKRPNIKFDVQLETYSGNHLAPLIQDPILIEPPKEAGDLLDTLNPLGKTIREVARDNVLKNVRDVEKSLIRWLDESL